MTRTHHDTDSSAPTPAGLSVADVLTVELEPLGAWPPGAPARDGGPQASGRTLADDGRISTGVWACTPGRFDSRRDGTCELMHFVAGSGTITDADGTVHVIAPGAVLYVPDGWRGTWDIATTVRKSYAIVTT